MENSSNFDQERDDIFNDLFPFGNIFKNPLHLDAFEHLQGEDFEIVKGNYKTKVSLRFNGDGMPMSCSYTSEYIPSDKEVKLNQLLLEKMKAIKEQRYEDAAKYRDEIKKLQN